jgi:hypothetical protein
MDSTAVELLTRDAPSIVQSVTSGGIGEISTSCPSWKSMSPVTSQASGNVADVPYTPESPIADALERLLRIEEVGPNWDSYGSMAPTHSAVMAAHCLIWAVHMASVKAGRGSDAPHSILPLPGGGIQVEWRGEAGNIEVEVSSEGVLGCLLTRGSGATREFEERDSLSQLQIIVLVRSVIG